jgi:PhnB protein
MARTSTYLNFQGQTEEAFQFYRNIFGGQFGGGGVARFSDLPAFGESVTLSEKEMNQIMHIELPIVGGHVLMGSDAPESMGFKITMGNNVHINLEPDTRIETDRLFSALSDGGQVVSELQTMFWGAYYGSCIDKYGIQWMFNCNEKV